MWRHLRAERSPRSVPHTVLQVSIMLLAHTAGAVVGTGLAWKVYERRQKQQVCWACAAPALTPTTSVAFARRVCLAVFSPSRQLLEIAGQVPVVSAQAADAAAVVLEVLGGTGAPTKTAPRPANS
jgi:hypothetical protein